MNKILVISTAIVAALAIQASIAGSSPKKPVEFYKGHWHSADGVTHGAPQHSGGTNPQGCHNASVPYHCH